MVQNRHTFADAAYVMLLERGESLHYKELARGVLEAGYFVSRGKTPEQTLRSQISREIRQQEADARFVNEDAGVISLSDQGRNSPDTELIEAVQGFATRQASKGAKAAKAAAKAPAKKKTAKAKAAAEPAAKPAVEAEAVKAPVAKAAPKPVAKAAPKPTAAAPAAEAEVKEEIAFIPVDLGEVDYDREDEDVVGDGTFASRQQEILVHDDPEDADVANAGASDISRRLEEDTEQDFLSVGPDLREMTSTVYNASMDELAPIVVPPHEGGAAEIARLPMGGRSVLIVKVVRRKGRAQIQLVEELESLISGVVGRLLLTLPGDDLPDFLEALVTTRKVIEGSFVPGDAEDDRMPVYVD